MTNGAIERIRCKATYAVNATGNAVQQTLRCASDSYRFEISSNVISEGGSLSGSWAEATRGVSGNISGRASGAEIVANVAGAGFTARLDVWTRRKQSCRDKATRHWHRRDSRGDRFAQKDEALRPAYHSDTCHLSHHEVAWKAGAAVTWSLDHLDGEIRSQCCDARECAFNGSMRRWLAQLSEAL